MNVTENFKLKDVYIWFYFFFNIIIGLVNLKILLQSLYAIAQFQQFELYVT